MFNLSKKLFVGSGGILCPKCLEHGKKSYMYVIPYSTEYVKCRKCGFEMLDQDRRPY